MKLTKWLHTIYFDEEKRTLELSIYNKKTSSFEKHYMKLNSNITLEDLSYLEISIVGKNLILERNNFYLGNK